MLRTMTKLAIGLPALALFATTADAETAQPDPSAPSFRAAPFMVKAGDEVSGKGRLYPSPVIQDMNGDGLADIVVGDLFGYLTVAHRLPGDGMPAFGPEGRLKDREGKDLKFSNW